MTDVSSLERAATPDPSRDTGSETAPASPELPSAGNRARMLVLSAVLLYLAAMSCNAVLELLQTGGDFNRLVRYTLDEGRLLFLMSSGVLFVLLLAVVAATNRLFLSVALMLSASLVVGFANAQKLMLRQEPLYPSDFVFAGQAGFLKEMVGLRPLLTVTVLLVLIFVICLVLGRIAARVFPPVRRRTEPRRWRRLLVARLVVLALVTAFVAYAAQFNDSGNKLRALYETRAHWAFWFQKVNYERNGAVAGFLYNLNGPVMTEPADYDADTMAEISAKYTALADRLNRDRSADALAGVNIVVVLSEAFADPTALDGVTLAEDPIPFTRELMRTTRSGSMLAQLFGGGTANMEFEALTGLSLSQFLPQMNTPYQMLVTDTPTFPSVVGYLNEQGREAIAIHPYMTSMYKRYAVYPTLGFSEFVHESTMQSVDRIDDNEFISDAAAFAEVERQLEETSDPAFINLVTMQNHYPMAGNYEDPIPAEGVSGDLADELTHYARGLKHSDDALRDFIGRLQRSGEKTAVVFYGDHAPAFWSGEVYEKNGAAAFRRTPYFIWTNFKELPAADEPVTSPIYFLPTLLDDLEAPLPPYYALLRELHREIPAMEQGEYFLPDGSQVPEDDLSPRAQALLEDYRLVQYDLTVGERYSQGSMFYPAE